MQIPLASLDSLDKFELIRTNLQGACKAKFLQEFGYAYKRDETTPSAIAPDRDVWGIDDLIIHENDLTKLEGVKTCLRDDFVKNAPEWGKDAIAEGLIEFVSPLFDFKGSDLAFTKYEQSFSDGGNKTYQLRVIIYYKNLEATIDGVVRTYLIMSYCGVGYLSI